MNKYFISKLTSERTYNTCRNMLLFVSNSMSPACFAYVRLTLALILIAQYEMPSKSMYRPYILWHMIRHRRTLCLIYILISSVAPSVVNKSYWSRHWNNWIYQEWMQHNAKCHCHDCFSNIWIIRMETKWEPSRLTSSHQTYKCPRTKMLGEENRIMKSFQKPFHLSKKLCVIFHASP